MYQDNYLGATNTYTNDVEIYSEGTIESMREIPIISIKNYISVSGELDFDKPIYIVTEKDNNSFYCIFVKKLGEKIILKPKSKLNLEQVTKIKQICQKELKEK